MLLLHVPVQPDQIGCHSWHRLSEVLLHCSWTTWGSKEQVQRAKPSFFLLLSATLNSEMTGEAGLKLAARKTNAAERVKEGKSNSLPFFLISLARGVRNAGTVLWQPGKQKAKSVPNTTPGWSECLTLALWVKVTCILNILKQSFSTGFASGDFTSDIESKRLNAAPELFIVWNWISMVSCSQQPVIHHTKLIVIGTNHVYAYCKWTYI